MEENLVHEKHEKTRKMDGSILYREECFAIQGAVFDVYRELGGGFLKAVYQEWLASVHEKHERTRKMDGSILYREECFAIQGAVFDVYRELGGGFLEAVYQECLAKELSSRGIPFVAQQELKLFYKGEPLRQTYIPDFVCHKSIIVEIKALAVTTGEHKAQVLNYLKATGLRLGLLVNFGCHPKATVERIVL